MQKPSKLSRLSFRRFLCVSILIVGLSIYSIISVFSTTVSYKQTTYPSLTSHGSIYINSDSGFEVFPGSGTEEDPYVIEGYSITATSRYGIYIRDTTKYFVISNCYVDTKYSGYYSTYGIFIYYVASGTANVINNICINSDDGIYYVASGSVTLVNNTCSNNGYGIRLYSSRSVMVVNNTCNNNWYGILLSSPGGSTVANNTCNNNKKRGIWFSHSGSATIANNTCNNNKLEGIYLESSVSFTVTNNTCNYNNNIGIYIWSSWSATVINNTCSYNENYGIRLYSSVSATVANNTCNYNYIGIKFSSSSSSTVANNTCNNNNNYGIELYESSNFTIINNTFINCGLFFDEDTVDAFLSYTVENNLVNGKKLGFYTNLDSTTIDEPVYGQLILINCTNVTVRNQIITNTTIALFLYSCTYSTIFNNTYNYNQNGIYLNYAENSTISNNACNYNNDYSIYLNYAENSTVTNNICNNNGKGIYFWDSGSSMVVNNTCNYNNDYSIYLNYAENSTVTNNTCNNNGKGIYLNHAENSTVTNNKCENNNYGIYLRYSGSSTIINNTFTDCGLYIDESTVDVYLSYTLENNWVNGKILGFYTNLDSTIIDELVYGQLILVNCTNVTVRDQIINNTTVALFLYSCTYCTIINISCNYNQYGIYLSSSDNSVLSYNLLLENNGYGIHISSTSNTNLIHHNNFVDNNPTGTSQAYDGGKKYDGGKNNVWYNSQNLEGNYWSDWNGIGGYSIDGYAGTVDLYPLEEPVDFRIPQTTETTETNETNETNDNDNGCTSIIPFTQWFAVLGLAVIGLTKTIRKEKKNK